MSGASSDYCDISCLGPGDHLCMFYDAEDDRRSTLISFFKNGIENNEKVFYVPDFNDAAWLLEGLEQQGIDVKKCIDTGQLSIFQPNYVYCPGGYFEPDVLIDRISESIKPALQEGYTAMRGSSEMTWVLRGIPGSHRLWEYEAKANKIFSDIPLLAICQYDQRRFKSSFIAQALCTHPLVIKSGKCYRNESCYIPADKYLCSNPEENIAHTLLSNFFVKLQSESEIDPDSDARPRNSSAKTSTDNDCSGSTPRDSSPDYMSNAIATSDLSGRLTYVNNAFLTMWGYDSTDEVLGRQSQSCWQSTKAAEDVIRHLYEKGSWDGELVAKKRDGSTFPAYVSSIMIKDNANRTVCLTASMTDASQAKDFIEKMRRAQRINSLGIMIGGIAHDFNNILMGITGTISLARSMSCRGEDISGLLGEADKATLRAQELISRLIDFSKSETSTKNIISIETLLRDTTRFALSGSSSICEFLIQKNLWHVKADATQISQVMENLVINADQAMPDGGIMKLSAENIHVGKRNVEQLPDVRPGNYVKISLIDQGPGIPEKNLESIFNPYFTTKEQGSGLGLTTCKSIIDEHGGYITAISQQGKGSTFTIMLPAYKETQQSSAKQEEKKHIISGTGRVLVLDDDTAIRKVVVMILETFGYEADSAENGEEALEKYKDASSAGRPFDVVIMDLVVPGGKGAEETISTFKKFDPDVKAILSTGFSGDKVSSNFKSYGFVGVLKKPYDPAKLGEMLFNTINPTNTKPRL